MLTVQYFGKYPCPHLAPIACVYGFEESELLSTTKYNDVATLREFVETEKRSSYFIQVTTSTCRAASCDASDEVRNKYAFTGVCLMNVPYPSDNISFWSTMGKSIKVIRWMKEQKLDSSVIGFLEEAIWTSLSAEKKDYVSKITGNFMNQWMAKVSEKIYAPDYLWKTGSRTGETTIQWMKKKYEMDHDDYLAGTTVVA